MLMDRRAFLTAGKKKNVLQSSAKSGRNITSGLNPYTGAWTQNEVVHLLKRTMFGAKKTDVDYFLSRTMSQAVDELLTPTAPLPGPPLKNYDNTEIAGGDPDLGVALGQTWVNTSSADGAANTKRIISFKAWSVGQMINQDRSIREKLSLFWHNHFSTETTTIQNAIFVYKHHNLLRQNAVGNFKNLVKAVTIDPGMLIYLNGDFNTKSAPDENYARELQELFTLGKENSPNYSEDDVRAAARILTGWETDKLNNVTLFKEVKHDTQDKNFSSFYSNTVITGRTGPTSGDQELDALLNMIFSKSTQVSEFIVKKLYRWFVYYDIEPSTQANVIVPLAQLLRNSNWDIKPVLSTLFKSEHFFDVLSQGCQIKSPLDFVITVCREYGVVFPDATDVDTQYGMWLYIGAWAASLQQNIGDPPDVSGWKAYYQAPSFYEIWINSDTYPKRNQFTDILVYNGYTRNTKKIIIDPVAFAKVLPNPYDPNLLISDSLALLYRINVSQATRDQIKQDILLSGQTQDYYWSNAWNAYIANPADPMALQTVSNRLRDLYKYLMNLSEYHLA